jgi:hypothetical protein
VNVLARDFLSEVLAKRMKRYKNACTESAALASEADADPGESESAPDVARRANTAGLGDAVEFGKVSCSTSVEDEEESSAEEEEVLSRASKGSEDKDQVRSSPRSGRTSETLSSERAST